MRKPSSPNQKPTMPRSKSFRDNYQPTTNNSPKPSRKSRKGLAFLIFLLEFALLGTILYFHFGRGEDKSTPQEASPSATRESNRSTKDKAIKKAGELPAS